MLHPESINVQQLVREIVARIRALPQMSVPNVRPIRREFSRRTARAEAQQVIELAAQLLNESNLRWFAYELVYHHKAALSSLNAESLTRLGQGIASWGDVDPFAVYLAGPVWREHQVPDSLVHGWTRSQDRWWRRAALASTVALNNKARGGRGDPSRTLEVCRLLASDRDDMVVKALSWALRELVKHDPEGVHRFLDEYDDCLATQVKREVRNKLATGMKNPARS